MSSFFGVPVERIALGISALLAIAALTLGYRAWRWPIFLRLALRQLPRRPGQTALIVVGLALSSTLIAASLATGDTLTFALRSAAVAELGRLDELIISSEPPRPSPTPGAGGGNPLAPTTFFPLATYEQLVGQVRADRTLDRDVAALAPAIRLGCTMINPTSRQTSIASVVALPIAIDPTFGALTARGAPLALAALGRGETYLNESGGAALAAAPGHELACTVAGVPLRWTVRDVANKGGLDSSSTVNAYISLSALQASLQAAGVAAQVERPINQILVANRGDAITGATRSETVGRALREQLVDGGGLIVAQTLLQRGDLRSAIAVRRGALSPRLQRSTAELLDVVDSTAGQTTVRRLAGLFQDEQLRGAVLAAAREVPDETVATALSEALTRALSFRVLPVKEQVLAFAERAGNVISTIFLLFSLLSISAGVLLVFLIFSLLAASRRSELGITRALGAERGHLVTMFTLEGVAYAVLAALVGVPAGLAVSRGLHALLLWAVDSGVAGFTGAAVRLTETIQWHVEPRSIALAAALGLLLTVATVALAARQVARLTIVTAIRDLPDPPRRRLFATWWWIPLAGLSLVLTGLGRRRVVTGIEIFAVAGLLMIGAAVWALVSNGDTAARGLAWLLSRAQATAPALRVAAAHTLRQPLRTGLTMAMFALVIFMLTVMQVVTEAALRFHASAETVYGGWQIEGQLRAAESRAAEAVAAAATEHPGLRELVAGAGTRSVALFPLLQLDAPSPAWGGYPLVGIDHTFARFNRVPLQARALEYASDRAAWEAVAGGTGLGLIDAGALFNDALRITPAISAASFALHGPTDDNQTIEPPEVWVGNPSGTALAKIRVIGLIDRRAAAAFRGLHVSLEQLRALGPPMRPASNRLYFGVAPGGDVSAARAALGDAFYEDGLETVSLLDRFVNENGPLQLASRMLQLFVALGLVVGIAGLAVISSRAALERRQLIGILRAIGYERGAIGRGLLYEAALIVALGSVIGLALGLELCRNVFAVQFFDRFQQGLRMVVPWTQLAATVGLTCAAALLATWFPARQASRIPPIAALREV
jgi:putative ABC transport system permease protein